MSLISLAIHTGLVIFFSLVPFPTIIKARPTVYTVTLMPISLPAPEVPKTEIGPPSKKETPKPLETTKLAEKTKPIEKPKKDDIVEKVKKPLKQKEEPKEDKESLKHLQEALEEIRKKAALDEIRKKLAKAETSKERPILGPSAGTPSTLAPSRFPMVSSTQPSAATDSRISEYYSLIWAKIKEAWTLPENLVREGADLETVIVITIERDGRVQKSWFEKKSGNTLYDQMAMRAIKKADPLPPIPKDLGESALEIGIRFIED